MRSPATATPAAAAIPPIEVDFPDLGRWAQGNAGIGHAWTFGSDKAGPHVLVQALTHGNEFCGAIALDFLFKEEIKPSSGKLVLAFANVAAFARFDFDNPDPSRYIDEDYNRVWADDVIGGKRDSAELRRARELRPFVDAADYLLDLHSMHEPCRPIMVCGMLDKGAEFARRRNLTTQGFNPQGFHHKEESSMKVKPLHDRILVKRIETKEQKKGGIIIPDTAKEKPQEGKVIAVGTGKVQEDGKVRPLAVKKGDKILFGKYSGQEFKLDGQDLLHMREDDIIGIVD